MGQQPGQNQTRISMILDEQNTLFQELFAIGSHTACALAVPELEKLSIGNWIKV